VSAPFEILFQPLYPLLIGGVVALGADGVLAGQLVACGLGAFAIVPLFGLTEQLVSRRAAHVACALYAAGLWVCRHPAACLSEGPFYLAVLAAAHWIVVGRPVRAGLAVALAYAIRPEGLLLLLLAPLRGWPQARRVVAGFAALGWLVPALFWATGRGLVLTSKTGFVWREGIGGVLADQGAAAALVQYAENVARNLASSFETVGYLVVPLALVGLGSERKRAVRLLLAVFVAQLLLASLLRSHLRFLSGYGVLLLPLAAAGFERLRPRRTWLAIVALAIVLAPDLARLPRAVNAQRAVLRPLAQWLRPRLPHDGALATDMVRLEYFCGQRPWLPRRVTAGEFLGRCRQARTRIVVFDPRRGQLTAHELESLGFARLAPPAAPDEGLDQALRARGLLVYGR
jgi:hypothetical protein